MPGQEVAEAQPGLALRLYRHLALFVAANFQHMHIEETAHNTLLWAACTDAELQTLRAALAKVDPEQPLFNLMLMEDRIAQSLDSQRAPV